MCAATWLLGSYIIWRVEPIWLVLLSRPGWSGPTGKTLTLAKLILGNSLFLFWAILAAVFPDPQQLKPAPNESKWHKRERWWLLGTLRLFNSVPFGVFLLFASALFAFWLINSCLIEPLARVSTR